MLRYWLNFHDIKKLCITSNHLLNILSNYWKCHRPWGILTFEELLKKRKNWSQLVPRKIFPELAQSQKSENCWTTCFNENVNVHFWITRKFGNDELEKLTIWTEKLKNWNLASGSLFANLQAHGSCLKARGSRLMGHGHEKFGASHEHRGMSHEPWGISHEPLTLNTRLIL